MANETARSVRLPSIESSDFHESDDATQLSISFDVEVGYEVHTDLTSPGTALGAGQRVTMPPDTSGSYLYLLFDLTSDQTIGVSEVLLFCLAWRAAVVHSLRQNLSAHDTPHEPIGRALKAQGVYVVRVAPQTTTLFDADLSSWHRDSRRSVTLAPSTLHGVRTLTHSEGRNLPGRGRSR